MTSRTKKDQSDKSDVADTDVPVVPEQPESSLLDRLAALEAENARLTEEVAVARKARVPRGGHITPKQQKVIDFYVEHPDATPAEAFTAAGATASSHGLMWRIVELGGLRLVVPNSDDSGDNSDNDDNSADADESDLSATDGPVSPDNEVVDAGAEGV